MKEYLDKLISDIGYEEAARILEGYSNQKREEILTIVSNKGVHHLPDSLMRGEVVYASSGNLDFSSIDRVREQYVDILKMLSFELKKKKWDKVYVVPFGHTTLSMQIKQLVYRITRLETVDVFYSKEFGYRDLTIDQRALIVSE
ncbi:MAG: hypothetical protein CMO06_10130 [Thalassospira sp.]|uniref:hypothetical protein n=1 Tax=Thalassospira sp. TaxID=1912094 RepID=UPI000C563E4F|nr:hypothetical protein [Thalassospira sp.]MAZ33490.1 hypothetical protein [Thalassospira sp.]